MSGLWVTSSFSSGVVDLDFPGGMAAGEVGSTTSQLELVVWVGRQRCSLPFLLRSSALGRVSTRPRGGSWALPAGGQWGGVRAARLRAALCREQFWVLCRPAMACAWGLRYCRTLSSPNISSEVERKDEETGLGGRKVTMCMRGGEGWEWSVSSFPLSGTAPPPPRHTAGQLSWHPGRKLQTYKIKSSVFYSLIKLNCL